MTILWSFSYDSFLKVHAPPKNFDHVISNPCYNEVCYKGTVVIFRLDLQSCVFVIRISMRGSQNFFCQLGLDPPDETTWICICILFLEVNSKF